MKKVMVLSVMLACVAMGCGREKNKFHKKDSRNAAIFVKGKLALARRVYVDNVLAYTDCGEQKSVATITNEKCPSEYCVSGPNYPKHIKYDFDEAILFPMPVKSSIALRIEAADHCEDRNVTVYEFDELSLVDTKAADDARGRAIKINIENL